MCGIALIISGVVIGGHLASEELEFSGCSCERALEVSKTARPTVEDLCKPLERRGPDHVGGQILHVGPVSQHIDTWEAAHSVPAANEASQVCEQSGASTVSSCEAEDGREKCDLRETSIGIGSEQYQLSDGVCRGRLDFVGATLQLRGDHPVEQPLKDTSGNLLVFNGEVFGGLTVKAHENDTEVLMDALKEPQQSVPEVLSRLRGPWAIIYWQAASRTLWFGRDAIGRRSLLVHKPSPEDPRFLLTSVAPVVKSCEKKSAPSSRLAALNELNHIQSVELESSEQAHHMGDETPGTFRYWEELDCGIYSITFDGISEGESVEKMSVQSTFDASDPSEKGEAAGILGQRHLRGRAQRHSWRDPLLERLLAWERCKINPRKGSSGDCTHADQGKSDESFGTKNMQELEHKDEIRGRQSSVNKDKCQNMAGSDFLQFSSKQESYDQEGVKEPSSAERVLAALRQAVQRRTVNISREWGSSESVNSRNSCTKSSSLDSPAPVAVLFSGGLDSMILAAISDGFVEPHCSIDLLNVSFEGERAPDRITAISGVIELQEVFPLRRWRLIKIDAELSNLTSYRDRLLSLICPSKTYMRTREVQGTYLGHGMPQMTAEISALAVMDLNIGTALWLAASGSGHLHETLSPLTTTCHDEADEGNIASQTFSQQEAESLETKTWASVATEGHGRVKSEARVLLVGSGADEQCGGYGRHRTKFKLGGWESLEAEMKLDFQRIWKRNLGRDDRCLSDHGKEARFPFLDEAVVETLLSLPLWDVVNLQQPAGFGDKQILRQVANQVALLLGLKGASSLPKRAIQFGSRIARESNRKDFGSNRAANLASAGAAVLKNVSF